MLEYGTEALYVGVTLKEQVARLGFNVDDIARWGVSELEHNERSGHAGMTTDVVRDDLQGDVRLVRGFGQLPKLTPHDRGTANWPVERSFINDGPEPKDLGIHAELGQVAVADISEWPLLAGPGDSRQRGLKLLDRFLVPDLQHAERLVDGEPVAGGVGVCLVVRQHLSLIHIS